VSSSFGFFVCVWFDHVESKSEREDPACIVCF